jgi:RHS repeat-associated protein
MNIRHLCLQGAFALLALFGSSVSQAERTTTYYHNDGLGSVVAATNDSGQVLWRKDYAPYGEQIDTTPDTERQAYTGKLHDDVTGLTYFGARHYDPEMGRFLSPDPVAFVDDNAMSFNRYLYVNNNPYKYVDPDGEFLNFAAKFVLDVGINIALNYVTTGKLNVGGALRDSALGLMNPARTVARGGALISHMSKTSRTVNPSSSLTSRSGRLGNSSTRKHIEDVADTMQRRGWKIEKGGGRGRAEEYLPGPGGARKGSSYPDITATKNGKTLRVNTIDTRADGVTPTTREAANAARIRRQTGEHVLTVPKPK